MNMKVHVVIYTQGYSTGYKELIGIYSLRVIAEDMIAMDMRLNNRPHRNDYTIYEVELDRIYNNIYCEW